ncbi:10631_t:CDS:2 [Entrophospora sp. SA101]|nr:115_t:CDS:2 [Entrophospora sp. SA101]CAJ0907647.1 10631_t:CDS:2 [Entrophospora sp. SA101]
MDVKNQAAITERILLELRRKGVALSTIELSSSSTNSTVIDADTNKENLDEAEEDKLEDEKKVYNQQVDIDLSDIMKQLENEPLYVWKVNDINVTERFRDYQRSVIERTKVNKLTWHDTYEILAIASIIVLSSPCPYPNFTAQEWNEITKTNPYKIHHPVIPPSVSRSLQEAAIKIVMGEDYYMHPDNSEINKLAARTFNELSSIPPIDYKMSEELHCCKLLYPFTNPVFFGPHKEYEVQLNRTVSKTKQRPDFACIINKIPLLNSEIKPCGYKPLQKKKDIVKAQLRGKKAINQLLNLKGGPAKTAILTNMGDTVSSFIMDLQVDRIYRSWPFCTTKLVIDKSSMPLIESTFCHFVALEGQINILAKDFKTRSNVFTPPLQMSFMSIIPDSPQIKRLLK